VNPVEKVVSLLEKLQGEIEKEGVLEAKAYDKYACFCKENADNKQYAIEKFNESIDMMNGHVEAKTTARSGLDDEISKLTKNIKDAYGEQEAADKIREDTFALYTSRDANLTVEIKNLKDAVAFVESMGSNMELISKSAVVRSSLLLEKSLHGGKSVSKRSLEDPHGGSLEILATLKDLVKTFKEKKIQADKEEMADRHQHEMLSQARRYNIDMMEKAKEEKGAASAELTEEIAQLGTDLQNTKAAMEADENFLDDLSTKCATKASDWDSRSKTRTSELTAIANALEMLKGDVSKMYGSTGLGLVAKRKRTVKKAQPAKASKDGLRAAMRDVAKEEKAAGGHWQWIPDHVAAQTSSTVKQSSGFGATPVTGAALTTPAGSASQRLAAAHPAETVADATDDDVTDSDAGAQASSVDADDEDLETPFVGFLQLKVERMPNLARKKVIAFLSGRAAALKSAALSTLLLKMRDAPSPFAKVKTMIEELIKKLEADAQSEQSQKEWCDKETKNAKDERDEAQNDMDKLNAKLTEKGALTVSLMDEITTLSEQIADLQKALNEETVLREEEKLNNNMTVDEAQAGLDAVSNAIQFLEDFYNPEFIQTDAAPINPAEGYERYVAENAGSDGKTVDDMAPDAGGVSGEYGGKTEESKGILGMLAVIKKDFERAIEQTTDAEAAADADYTKFKTDTEQDMLDKGDLKKDDESKKTNAELDIKDAEADLRKETELHDNSVTELEKLKPLCVETGMTWEERTARREQEVASLKEALDLLESTKFSF
jgi:chromosome segregation ATPase